MEKFNIQKLEIIIARKYADSPNERVVYKDLFALGCYLHKIGNINAGKKICLTALEGLGFAGNKTFFNQVLKRLNGNEENFARGINAHAEVNQLFNRLNIESQNETTSKKSIS